MKKAFFLLSTFSAIMASAQNVGIGTSTPATKLHIRGTADVSQLFIDANSPQSSSQPLVRLRNGSGSDLLWINADHSSNAFVGLNTGRLNNATGGATGNSFFGSLSADSNTTGSNNTAIGREALASNIAGDNATAVGYQAMRYTNSTAATFSNTNTAVGYQAMRGSTVSGNNTGTGNTAVGYQSMLNTSNGFNNTAFGRATLNNNTSGDNNTAIGYQAMNDNTTGLNNTATGFQALFNTIDGDRNTAYGVSALLSNQGGNNGTAFGYGAMSLVNNQAASFTNTSVAFGYEALRGSASASANTGSGNSAVGYQALYSNNSGDFNTAMGYHSLYSNSTGNRNTGFGYFTLNDNSTGSQNTATGWQTLNSNTEGEDNTVSGANAMRFSTTGSRNAAFGVYALRECVAGSNGTAVGYNAMAVFNNSSVPFTNFNTAIGYEAYMGGAANASFNTGNHNTAVGHQALRNNLSGDYNVAMGSYALQFINTGSQNTGIGMYTLFDSGADNLTALGYSAGSAFNNFSGCTFLGYNSETNAGTYDNATAIGNGAIVTGSDRVRVGNTNVTSIGGQVGWTTFSDGRFKRNITENIPGLDFILKLRPVSYTTDLTALNEFTGVNEIKQIKESRGEKITAAKPGYQENIRHTGFIAQEVEAAAKQSGFSFSGVDVPANGKSTYGLRYAEFVVPLVKAVQEQQKLIEEQARTNSRLQEQLDKLTAELELLKKNK